MDNRFGHDVRSSQADIGETLAQRSRRSGVFRNNTGPPPERRSTISSMLPCAYQNNTRMRNLSGGSNGSTASGSSSGSSTQLDNQYSSDNQLAYFPLDIAPFANNSSTVPATRGNSTSSSSSHRKLDRSWSDNDNDRNGSHRSVNSSRYKTELCRPFEESGSCKYGDKCQFAHGMHELRNLARHPKYKTELCRTFHTVGFCPYGPRCHFIHEEDTKPADASPKLGRAGSVHSSSGSSSPSLSPSGSDDFSIFSYQSENSPQMTAVNVENRQYNSLTVNINNLGSKSNYDFQALERQLAVLNLNRSSTNDNSNVFSANNKKVPKPIGAEQPDIFSEITMFNSEEVLLDNAPKGPSSSCAMQTMKLDNFPSFMDTPAYWQSSYGENYFSQLMRSMDSFHHSPTGSDGSSRSSSSSGSDCGGSMESLANSSHNDWHCPPLIGQY